MFGSIMKAFAADGDLGRAIRAAAPQGIAGAVSQAASRAGAGTAAVGAALGGAGASPEKALYIAALAAAMNKANDAAFFNLETHINDLNVKLGNLRNSKAELNTVNELVKTNASAARELGEIVRKLGQATQQVIQHIR